MSGWRKRLPMGARVVVDENHPTYPNRTGETWGTAPEWTVVALDDLPGLERSDDDTRQYVSIKNAALSVLASVFLLVAAGSLHADPAGSVCQSVDGGGYVVRMDQGYAPRRETTRVYLSLGDESRPRRGDGDMISGGEGVDVLGPPPGAGNDTFAADTVIICTPLD